MRFPTVCDSVFLSIRCMQGKEELLEWYGLSTEDLDKFNR